MKTQLAAVYHQSSPTPPPPVHVDVSSVWFHMLQSRVVMLHKNNRIPSVHYTLPWKLEQQSPWWLVWSSLSFWYPTQPPSLYPPFPSCVTDGICFFFSLFSALCLLSSLDKTNPPLRISPLQSMSKWPFRIDNDRVLHELFVQICGRNEASRTMTPPTPRKRALRNKRDLIKGFVLIVESAAGFGTPSHSLSSR